MFFNKVTLIILNICDLEKLNQESRMIKEEKLEKEMKENKVEKRNSKGFIL